MIVRPRYLVVKKVVPGNAFYLKQYEIDDYQFCEVVRSSRNSLYREGDTLMVGNRICFDVAKDFGKGSYYITIDEVLGVLKDGVVYPSEDMVYIKADKYEKTKIEIGGVVFDNDTSYNPLAKDNVTQSGVVLAACLKAKHSMLGHDLKVEIESGDKVYCHHFLTDSDHEREINGEKYYELPYEMLYCKVVDGEIRMLCDWNFLSPIELEAEVHESGLLMELQGKSELRVGLINYSSKSLEERGLFPGDKVYFKRGREYEMDVEGKTYYRIETRDILCKYEKMEALREIVVVKEIKEGNERNGLIQTVEQNPIPDKGKVLSVGKMVEDIEVGDTVVFRKMANSEVTINGEKVLLMESKNIYMKI